MDISTLIPLLENSLMVALGAIITGTCLWLAQRRAALGRATPSNRRLEIMETVSRDVGNVNHTFAKYSSLVIESTRFGGRWPQARKEELGRVNNELVQEFRKMAEAESQLLMLGEKALEKNLRLYGAKIAQFRKQVYVGRQDISEKDIVKLKQEIQLLREQFYDILSRKYDRLLAA